MIAKRNVLYSYVRGGALLALAVVLFLFLQKTLTEKKETPGAPTVPIVFDATLEIKGKKTTIPVSVADTEAERAQGLSFTRELTEGRGKLFLFDAPGTYGFWMKDMRYPIDIVWIDSTWKVVAVTTDIAPETYPQVFYPPTDIRYVLELGAGDAERQGIVGGTTFLFKRNF